TSRRTKSCVLDNFPIDGFDSDDVLKSCASSTKLCDVSRVVLVRSGLSYVWFNLKCDLMFRKKDDNSSRIRDAKVIEEPHGFVDSFYNVAPAVEHDNDVEEANQDNDIYVVAYYIYLESSLEKDEGNSSRNVSVLNLRSGKRLGPPPRYSNTTPSRPDCAGTFNALNPPSPDEGDTRQDFSSPTLGEEIEFILFPLAPRTYYMPYPFAEGESSSPPREDLNQLWTLVKETLNIRQASSDKEKELWVELKSMFEPDFEDQLWTHTQALMHDLLEWKLYDTCGVHH
nr:hypothetical protein [Tanacetum cinerariifolium]